MLGVCPVTGLRTVGLLLVAAWVITMGVVSTGPRAVFEIMSSKPTMIQLASREEPPAARNGVVRPVKGISRVTPPITTKHCSAMAKERPQARSFPNASRVAKAARNPRVKSKR